MNPDDLARLIKSYRAVEMRSGIRFPCLEEGGVRADALETESEDDKVTIRLQGPMDGWFGASARDIIEVLDEHDPKEIMLLIESPGGFVHEGLALYSDLRARAEKDVVVKAEARGVVASAAVLPYLAGDTRTMGDGSMLMVHNPWGVLIAVGDYADTEKASKQQLNGLKSHTTNYLEILAKRTKMTKQAARKAMDDETWYTADQAIDSGYAAKAVPEMVATAERDLMADRRDSLAASLIKQYR